MVNKAGYFERYLKGCAGKVQYKNLISAEFVLHNEHTISSADIYKCRDCGFLHIGTSGNKDKKPNQNRNKIDNEQHKHKHKKFKY